MVSRENPRLRVELQVDSSNVLLEQLSQGKLDIMIGRLFERQHTPTGFTARTAWAI